MSTPPDNIDLSHLSESERNLIMANRRALQTQIDDMKSRFAVLDAHVCRRIPEDVFRRYFLPFFLGEMTNQAHEVLPYWFKIAGAATKPVDVVNSRGQVIARVPPLHDQSFLRPIASREDRNGPSMAYIFNVMENQKYTSDKLAQSTFNRAVVERARTMFSNLDNSASAQAWAALFKAFNVTPKFEMGASALPNTANNKALPAPIQDDEYDY